MATGYEPSAQRSPGIQPRNDQSVQPRAPRGATNDVKPKNLSSGQGTTLEIAAESHRSVQGKATELHPFGAANREVPVIGQGPGTSTTVTAPQRSARCAPLLR